MVSVLPPCTYTITNTSSQFNTVLAKTITFITMVASLITMDFGWARHGTGWSVRFLIMRSGSL